MFFYYRATETQVTKVEDSTEKTDESAVPDDIKAFYQKIDEDDDDEEESKGLIFKLFNPNSIYSCSLDHILEHEFWHLGCLAVSENFLKQRNFC